MKRWRSEVSWQRAVIVLAFGAFFALIVLSNGNDWDHFLTGFEVDLRSWLIDHEPPRWSYQLCGGVTRSGDPQAFGLSPLFLFALLFGSFWGVKLLVLACLVAGYFSLKQLLLVLARHLWSPPADPERWDRVVSLLSLLFMLGNHFIWHLHAGQVTFALHYLVLGLCYFATKALLEGLRWRDGLLGALLLWAYASGGFYHSLIFFVLPLVLCGMVFWAVLAVRLIGRDRAAGGVLLRRSGQLLALIGAGLGLSAHKLLAVLQYQLNSPRQLSVGAAESSNPLIVLALQLVPLFQERPPAWVLPAAAGNDAPLYGAWEYSSFNLLAWGAIAAGCYLGWCAWRCPPAGPALADPQRRWWLAFLVGYLTLVLLFALGECCSLAPHTLLNRWLLAGSIRDVGRYGVGLSFGCALLALYLGRRLFEQRPRQLINALWLLTLLCLINLGLHFGNTSVDDFVKLQQLPQKPMAQMRVVAQTYPYDGSRSYMYPVVLLGAAVLNCYDPLARPQAMAQTLADVAPQQRFGLPLLAGDLAALGRSCVEGSYFTQNTLRIDPSCPAATCVNLNAVDDDAAQRMQLDVGLQRWCLRP